MPGRVGAARAGGARLPEPVRWAPLRVAPAARAGWQGGGQRRADSGLGVQGASELRARVGEGALRVRRCPRALGHPRSRRTQTPRPRTYTPRRAVSSETGGTLGDGKEM